METGSSPVTICPLALRQLTTRHNWSACTAAAPIPASLSCHHPARSHFFRMHFVNTQSVTICPLALGRHTARSRFVCLHCAGTLCFSDLSCRHPDRSPFVRLHRISTQSVTICPLALLRHSAQSQIVRLHCVHTQPCESFLSHPPQSQFVSLRCVGTRHPNVAKVSSGIGALSESSPQRAEDWCALLHGVQRRCSHGFFA